MTSDSQKPICFVISKQGKWCHSILYIRHKVLTTCAFFVLWWKKLGKRLVCFSFFPTFERSSPAIHMCQLVRLGETYILKGVTDALFLDSSNYHTRISKPRQCWVTATGCCICISVVCCEGIMPSSTLYGCIIYSKRGCFSVCSFAIGCGRPEE